MRFVPGAFGDGSAARARKLISSQGSVHHAAARKAFQPTGKLRNYNGSAAPHVGTGHLSPKPNSS